MEMSRPLWKKLPAELRHLILQHLIQAVQQDGGSLAPYAAVCPEWQASIEPVTFRSLKLTLDRLKLCGFDDMAARARELGLVRHIDLFASLAEYDCADCRSDPTDEERQVLKSTVFHVLEKTFQLLSEWKPGGNLSLDMTAQSPSDSQHHFRHTVVGSRARAEEDERRDRLTSNDIIHDPRHGWENGTRLTLPPGLSIIRLYGGIQIPAKYWQGLPLAPAVTSLSLRRQTTRRWGGDNVYELISRLPGLKELYYEPWRSWGAFSQRDSDKGFARLFTALPFAASTLSKLVIFEDFSESYIKRWCRLSPFTGPEWFGDRIRRPNRKVSAELARASAKLPCLEHLSASFLIDATHFFAAVISLAHCAGGAWSNLASLVLTSGLLTPDESATAINDLLEAAAEAAAAFPALGLMELWNGRKGLACVFRYEAPPAPRSWSPAGTDRCGSITWRAMWDVELEARVTERWEGVARRRNPGGGPLQVVKDVLDGSAADAIQSHGDSIHHLHFLHDVLHPVSLPQIRRENMHQGEGSAAG